MFLSLCSAGCVPWAHVSLSFNLKNWLCRRLRVLARCYRQCLALILCGTLSGSDDEVFSETGQPPRPEVMEPVTYTDDSLSSCISVPRFDTGPSHAHRSPSPEKDTEMREPESCVPSTSPPAGTSLPRGPTSFIVLLEASGQDKEEEAKEEKETLSERVPPQIRQSLQEREAKKQAAREKREQERKEQEKKEQDSRERKARLEKETKQKEAKQKEAKEKEAKEKKETRSRSLSAVRVRTLRFCNLICDL